MKKLFLASAVLFGFVASASAADLGSRPYTYTKSPVPSPVTNWSGFYVGVMGGYGWSDQIRLSSLGGGIAVTTSDLQGGFGGGTIGYSWQAPGSQFVWGFEVDAAGSGIGYSETQLGVTVEDKIRSFGSVTGRLGIAANSALFYVKGGYAWADNRFTVSNVAASFSESRVSSGWTVGGGLEYMFAPAWSGKIEYMYADYGNQNYLSNNIVGGIDVGATVHTIKAGVNYHFNWTSLRGY
ncbi:MAG: hypothetical protein BGP05_21905 [Rhizobiales bacterium 62-47]|nr:porin family protein [Hyphomicrobiales bacterium]OJY10326.1 MAG: hypothetical protein BGP05_21905 [Rhizobiales bacterium 62-47]